MFASPARFCLPLLVAGIFFGQLTPQPLEFEVASIRPSDPGASQDGHSLTTNHGSGVTVKNGSVRTLIAFAFGMRELRLSGGPGWVATDHFDITAKAGSDLPPMTDDRIREMLRSLLAKRFGLVIHNETRDQNVYALVIAKNGSKLKAGAAG